MSGTSAVRNLGGTNASKPEADQCVPPLETVAADVNFAAPLPWTARVEAWSWPLLRVREKAPIRMSCGTLSLGVDLCHQSNDADELGRVLVAGKTCDSQPDLLTESGR